MSAVLSAVDLAYEEAARVLHTGRRFLVTGHRNPDGDALGSALALALAAIDAGKDARVVMRDGFSSAYTFLPGIEQVVVTDTLPPDWPKGYDAVFAMECPEPLRIGFPLATAGAEAPPSGPLLVNVDHHPGNTGYGNVNLVDLPAAATGEIVADLLDRLEWPITPAVATNLWVALVSDTGSFRYGNTTPKALALGARLVAAGAKPAVAGEALFESVPLASLKLEALVLSTLELHDEGRVATVELPARYFAESGAGLDETEGLVNRARSVAGVRAAALLRETVPGEVKCSLRSKGTVDVRAVAARHGGGGHKNASGCRVSGTLADAKALLVREIAEAVALTDSERTR